MNDNENLDLAKVYENDLFLCLDQFCIENDIADLKKESQSVWNSALYYIYKNVFKGTTKLKSKELIKTEKNPITGNYNLYDYDLVLKILDIYIYDMCMKYDKEVSVVGFTTLTGINPDTYYSWGLPENVGKLSSRGTEVFKKLYTMREESLSNKLATGNKNPVGVLAMLNRWYGWNLPGVTREHTERQTLSASELPKLGEIEELPENPD